MNLLRMNTCRLAFFIFAAGMALSACHHPQPVFTSLSADDTNIGFRNELEKHKAFGILYYLYYYNGGGVAIGDINNDGLPDIYFSANSKGHNKLYLNKGNFKFEDITDKAAVAGSADWCSGVTMADVNGDGYLDIYVSAVSGTHQLTGKNELFINNKNGTFTESAARYGLDFTGFTSQTVFFDYDHDGDLDCFIVNQSHNPNGNIVDTSIRRKFSPFTGNYLFRNDVAATGKFTDVSTQAGMYQSVLCYGLGVSVADMNNDGWDDIYIGNDFHENDYYYVNNGNGTFTESGAQHFNHYSRFSMGNDIADYNNDGQPDIITADMLPGDEKVLKTYGSDENADIYQFKLMHNGFQYQYSRNCLQRNNGSGSSFSEVGLQAGVSATDWSWCPLLADFDNDGNKDLFITSGIVKRPVDLDYIKFVSNLAFKKALNQTDALDDTALNRMPDGASHPFLYRGNGETFTDVSKDWGTGDMKGYYNGAAYADLDGDGTLDLVINCIEAPAVVLKNMSPRKGYLSITFKGDGMNRTGIGTKAYLFQKGKLQYEQLMLTRGFQSSSDSRLHFGLNGDSVIDSILIVWPDQRYQVISKPAANSSLSVLQSNAGGQFSYASFFKPVVPLLTEDSAIQLSWQHHENAFVDFNVQYLIPHEESARGPKVAVGDVNGDGLDDFYACGAAGQAGAMMIQQASGQFAAADTAVFNAGKYFEDVDAVFFDANGDGHPDLYVVSGGNERAANDPLLADRLYINDGKGRFSQAAGALPSLLSNKSCVSVADIDHDGDLDLFAGTLADAKAYGRPQTSYLLLNDGKAHFTLAPEKMMELDHIGMVTAASFADLNGDGWPELVVAGEWMPVTVFKNNKGIFEKLIIDHSTGWWQTLLIDDVNGDGHPDILAGNWGWNNKFTSGKNGPVRLYVTDFDLNGQTDQLLSYTLNGEEYPFLAKDEVERALPLLRRHYLLYAEYAGVPMKDVFYGWIDTVKPVIAERLGSAVCYGDGKGSFSLHDLPAGLQSAPVMTFQKLTQNGAPLFLAGGNFFDVIPYEGRYDAQPLALFRASRNSVEYIAQSNLSSLKGQVRDIKKIHTARGDRIIVARNNEPLMFYRYNQ